MAEDDSRLTRVSDVTSTAIVTGDAPTIVHQPAPDECLFFSCICRRLVEYRKCVMHHLPMRVMLGCVSVIVSYSIRALPPVVAPSIRLGSETLNMMLSTVDGNLFIRLYTCLREHATGDSSSVQCIKMIKVQFLIIITFNIVLARHLSLH